MAQELQEGDSFRQAGDLDFFKNRTSAAIGGFFFVGLFVFALGLGLFLFKDAKSDEIQIINSSQNPATSEIVVHVDGSVASPGVYRLKSESRVGDAISAAGGLLDGADRSRINLAARLVDGQKIFVAKDGELEGGEVAGSVNTLISINNASASELDKLPGIGPVTAEKIINLRPYGTLEELVSKKAVSISVFEKIKHLIAL